jgi:L-amino acid N-acyltransferase YncA
MSNPAGGRRLPAAQHEQTPGRVQVRPATEVDIEAIQRIYAHHVLNGSGSFEERPPGAAEMAARREAVAGRGLPYLVAETHVGVRGFGYAAPFRRRSAYRFTVEDSLYVDPDAVGLGIGRLLLSDLVARCTAQGYQQMVAVIGDSANRRSIRLHRALGFRHAGTLTSVGRKFDRWLDVVFMQRALTADISSAQDP